MALRYTRWKVIFDEQRAEGFKVWSDPFVKLRWPMLIDLRSDPFEKGPMGSIYYSESVFRPLVFSEWADALGSFLRSLFRHLPSDGMA